MTDRSVLPSASADPNHAVRWLVLAIVGVAQLMVVLDATIVNIALPSAQADLRFSEADRQWVVTAYALAFGSLLLIGGRLGDLFGRKQMFVIGLIGFAGASALGGAAGSFELLVAARALQGVFAALLAPAALAILSVTFSDPAERGKAFGIFGAIAGVGAGLASCWAVSSPTGCRGAGASTSTSSSRSQQPSAPSSGSDRTSATGPRVVTPVRSTSSGSSPARSACSPWSSPSRRPRPAAGTLR